jgi:beta-galactosidase
MAAGAAAVAACAVLLAPLLRGRRGPFLPRHALQLDGSSAAGAPAAASAGSMMNRRRPGEDEKRANPSAFPPGSQQAPPPPPPPRYFSFPPGFVWGAATSSYQIEGAASEGGRTPSVWDDFCALRPSPILDGSSGDVACDHYHRAEEDADLIQSLGFTAYRFSVSWSRVLRPDGSINPPGVGFYSRLIDALLRRGIEPWVTMHHWDLPSHLEGGWLNRSTVDAFERYADVLLQQYGDRVERWITVNEPWTVSAVGYGSGEHAPGHASASEPYLAGHHLLLAHAGAVRAFRRRYGGAGGRGSRKIGIANSGDYRYPRDPESQADREAAERAMLFQWGWFVHPLVHGDYPPAMREILGPRLPEFTAEERELVLGSYDFLGLNYYSSLLASDPGGHPGYEGYWADMRAGLTSDPGRWEQNDMGWNVAPDGLRDMLRWIAASYGSPEIYVTENGSAEPEPDLEAARRDTKRAEYFERHLAACAEALLGSGGGGGQPAAVDLRGYFAWSLLDNFEWQFGYTRRFGIAFVDFDPASPTYLDRTPKGSARFLAETIRAGGTNLGVRLAPSREEEDAEAHRQRTLPGSVIVGYGSNVQAVKRAVREGVNVVIWSFVDFRSDADGSVLAAPSLADQLEPKDAARREQEEAPPSATVATNLDLAEVRRAIRELDEDGFRRTVHLMSVGGWNGRHLDPNLSALDWYGAYRHYVGDLFHGIDWDLEGNDDLSSPYNVFTLDCLDKMADISRLAKTGTFCR